MIQTTSPEIGQQLEKALRDAGYLADSFFIWYEGELFIDRSGWDAESMTRLDFSNQPLAFSQGELTKMLEGIACGDNETIKIELGYYGDNEPYTYTVKFERFEQYGQNPCDLLARLVIWCIENNHPLNLPKNEQ